MTEIKIFWNSDTSWNEICARLIEQFGLPGNRYTTNLSNDGISVTFKNYNDAFLCKLFLSEHL